MINITNNPTVSEAFKDDEVKRFLKNFLRDLDDPYVLKSFLKDGYEKFYDDQIAELSRSFIPVTIDYSSENKNTYKEVQRCIDGEHFKVGDMVIDMLDPQRRVYPIGLIYSDDRGLHIQLKLDYKSTILTLPDVFKHPAMHSSVTWRNLNNVELLKL